LEEREGETEAANKGKQDLRPRQEALTRKTVRIYE